VQIFATDLDMEAIEYARQGIYLDNIRADISPERIVIFLSSGTGTYCSKRIEGMIVFAQHNIIKDAPFYKTDLICCRNLLIYLNTELQKKNNPLFHYSLATMACFFSGRQKQSVASPTCLIPFDPNGNVREKRIRFLLITA